MHTKYGEELAYIRAELAQPPLHQKPQAPYKKVLLSKFLRLGTSLGFYFPSSTLKSSFWHSWLSSQLPGALVPSCLITLQCSWQALDPFTWGCCPSECLAPISTLSVGKWHPSLPETEFQIAPLLSFAFRQATSYLVPSIQPALIPHAHIDRLLGTNAKYIALPSCLFKGLASCYNYSALYLPYISRLPSLFIVNFIRQRKQQLYTFQNEG